jgi:hypothetical protein
MKRLLLVLAAALVWAILSPAPVSAGWWPFGHHSKAKSASDAGQPPAHKEKAHHSIFRRHVRAQSQHVDPATPLYTSGPKSVGWWHKTPGPAGAGS